MNYYDAVVAAAQVSGNVRASYKTIAPVVMMAAKAVGQTVDERELKAAHREFRKVITKRQFFSKN